jgi:hypothetical protein
MMTDEQRQALEAARARIANRQGETNAQKSRGDVQRQRVNRDLVSNQELLTAQARSTDPEAFMQGRQMSPYAQGALTAAQGATFNFADELAGLVNPRYREIVRGATGQFGADYPMGAPATEFAGGLVTAPFTGALSLGRGASTIGNIARAGVDFAAQGALSGAGAADQGDRTNAALQGATVSGILGGAGSATAGILNRVVGQPILSRVPQGIMGMVPESAGGYNVRPDYARERLAQLLEQDARARLGGAYRPGQGAEIASARLGKLGPEAPIAASGTNTLAEIDMLSQLPGTAEKRLRMSQRRIAGKRGETIASSAETITGVRKSADDELTDLAKLQSEKSGPLYQKLQTVRFPVDEELQNILGRAKFDLGGAERSAVRRGEPVTPIRSLKQGDELPFASADQLKRTLWDKAAAARKNNRTNEANEIDQLRIDLVKKLDQLSPDYAQARNTFAGIAELKTAVEKGQDAFGESAKSLRALTQDMTQSELDAFRIGAVDSLRGVAGTQAGQTKLLNMYKEPEMQGKLRAIFGNDFRKFQSAILAQEELKTLERAGSNSPTFKRFARANEQGEQFNALQAAQQAVSNPAASLGFFQEKATKFGMPEEQRNRLARLLLLRGNAREVELANMEEYMRRRAAGQALGRQAAGRFGAFGAAQE